MKQRWRLVLMAATLAAATLSWAQPTLAGCNANVKFVNKDAVKATVHLDTSKVKIKNGTWKKLGTGTVKIGANKHKSKSFSLDFGCSKQRQWKFYVSEPSAGSKTLYKPNQSDFMSDTNFSVNINF
jgi:hypothetical protein